MLYLAVRQERVEILEIKTMDVVVELLLTLLNL
jgi:hypothetical protein